MKLKKIPIKFISILGLSVVLISALSYFNKDRVNLNNSSGSIKSLGDMSLIYNTGTSMLGYENIIINKDGVKYKRNFSNELYESSTKDEKKYNFVPQNLSGDQLQGINHIYKTDKYYGSISVISQHEGNTSKISKSYIEVEDTDLSSNTTKHIKLPIREKFKDGIYGGNLVYRYNGKIYTILNDYTDNIFYFTEIDIDKGSYKTLNKIQYEGNENSDTGTTSFNFINDDKIYIEMESTPKDKEWTKYFLVYDITKNTVSKSNVYINSSEPKDSLYVEPDILDYEIKDDKLSILTTTSTLGKNKYIKIDYAINGTQIKRVNKESYDIDFRPTSKRGANSVRLIDDKIYSLIFSRESVSRIFKGGKPYTAIGLKHINLSVFDTKLKKDVYSTNIETGDTSPFGRMFFLKN